MEITFYLTAKQHYAMLLKLVQFACPLEEEGKEDWVHGITLDVSSVHGSECTCTLASEKKAVE